MNKINNIQSCYIVTVCMAPFWVGVLKYLKPLLMEPNSVS